MTSRYLAVFSVSLSSSVGCIPVQYLPALHSGAELVALTPKRGALFVVAAYDRPHLSMTPFAYFLARTVPSDCESYQIGALHRKSFRHTDRKEGESGPRERTYRQNKDPQSLPLRIPSATIRFRRCIPVTRPLTFGFLRRAGRL